MKNVEIKAIVRNLSDLLSKAQSISDTKAEIIKQLDTFYNVPSGKLKLRQFENKTGELIFYERPETEGPKLSKYEKVILNETTVDAMQNLMLKALGCAGKVKKTRHLFMVKQTRIHIDSVEGLGDFMELEVVLKDQNLEEGERIAHSLMKQLGIEENDLIPCAYVDLLNK